MRHCLIALATLVCLALTFQGRAWAAGNEFTSTLKSTYTVATNGATHVSQTFDITNNFSTIYVTEYALEVGSNRINNVVVQSGKTTLNPTITPHGNKTSIAFTFADKIIGKDQTREFIVSYDSDDVAVRTGNTTEINIPKLANPDEFASYIVNIVVDGSWGTPALATPATYTTQNNNGANTVTFTNVGAQNGISVIFGKQQIARFALNYNLENPTGQKGVITVALPPDASNQRVYFNSINPTPTTISRDGDGNWLASYTMEPGQKQTVKAQGFVLITLAPQTQSGANAKPGKEYLASSPYWQTTDPNIMALAQKLKTPKAIYDYVVKTLTYDYNRLEGSNKRLGAVEALKNPQNSVCLEFTDLFVAIARAAGIPAREVNGFAYTQNDTLRPLSLVRDVLHAWPQYWDDKKQQWISVDPTWGNTTGGVDYFSHMDFNHIIFAIHGLSAEQPLAAGLYKFAGSDSKDITLTFVPDMPKFAEDFGANAVVRPSLLPSNETPYILHVHNKSLFAIYDEPYVVHTVLPNGDTVNSNGTINLLPLGQTDIPLHIPGNSIFSSRSITIEAQIGSQQFNQHLNVQSFINQHRRSLIIALSVGISAIVVALITRRLLVPRWQR